MQLLSQANINTALAFLACIIPLVIKGCEIWANRFRIEVTACFGDAECDPKNTIFVHNLSNKPITITYFELLLYKRENLRWRYKSYLPTCFSDGSASMIFEIKAHSSEKFTFKEIYFFDTSSKYFFEKRLYFSMGIVGKRKPVKYLIYPNR